MNQYTPMLASETGSIFSSKEWFFEIKWDGIRAISYVNDNLHIKSRNQKELKNTFPELTELTKLTKNVVLDGEIIIMKEGKVNFQAVLKRIQLSSAKEIERIAKVNPATYVVFDILEKDGKALTHKTLIERKRILKETVAEGNHVVISSFVEERGEDYYNEVRKRGLEGVIAKKKLSIYQPGVRSSDWLKIKKIKSCDCIICGYTPGRGIRKTTFGALILGLFDGKVLRYIGKVGTGFSQNDLESLAKLFKPLETTEIPFHQEELTTRITWLNPILVCQVGFQSVTETQKLRAPRFKGLRSDKPPAECTLDQIIN